MIQKKCSKCGELKDYLDFYKDNRTKTKLKSECKICHKIAQLNWKNNNLERVKKNEQKYRSLGFGKIAIKKWREKNLDKARLYGRLKERKRRAEKKETDLSVEYIEWLKEKIGDICPYCLEYNTGKWELDHIIPLSRGGTHTQDNVFWCCQGCNRRKHNKLLSGVNLLANV